MNHLISIRTNILYAKEDKKNETDDDKYKKFHELIFLVDQPTYRRTNDGEIVRERGVDEVRFIVSDKAFENMLELLTKLKDVDESELA